MEEESKYETAETSFSGGVAYIVSASILHAQLANDELAKANGLLARMTVQEKIGQMNQLFLFPGAPPNKEKGATKIASGAAKSGRSYLLQTRSGSTKFKRLR